MIEKVNPSHPDKVADRIAGAIVDLAYTKEETPKIAVEVLIGHGECNIIIESSVMFDELEIENIVHRITETNNAEMSVYLKQVPQDVELAKNQAETIRCGDNGIFKGVPLTNNEKEISKLVRTMYSINPTDGKYILTDDKLIICQSNMKNADIEALLGRARPTVIINPLGEWTGGTNVDTGATNRKLGSDMGQSVTGGGLHGKDLSKADVSVNIYAFQKAQELGKTINICCAIGDEYLGIDVEGEKEIEVVPYKEIVDLAREYIKEIGGFEKFAEWGLY